MGVYIIKDEVIQSRSDEAIRSFNSLSDTSCIYTYSYYKYTTKFIGYVVNTSIETSNELNQEYKINSNNFSSSKSSKDIFSEYYIYLLIDPQITTKSGIDELFDDLNKDNINLVYDGTADKNIQKKIL